jgi:hypothetical protein
MRGDEKRRLDLAGLHPIFQPRDHQIIVAEVLTRVELWMQPCLPEQKKVGSM